MDKEPNGREIVRLYARLFVTGCLQVTLVSLNTYQVSHRHWVGAGVVGFLISLCWSFNVRGVGMNTRFAPYFYSAGAMSGTLIGMLISTVLYGE